MRRCIACIVLLFGCGSVAWAQEEAVLIDGVCARVNRDIITLSEYRQAQQDLRAELAQQFSGQQLEKEYQRAVKNLLQNLIETQLLVQKADELGVNVEAQINEFLINMAKKNNVPPSKIDEMLKKMGFDPDQARQMLRVRFQRQAVIGKEVYSQVSQNVFDKDVEAYYQEHLDDYSEPAAVKLSEIFIKFEGRTREQAKDLALQLIAQINAGADFAELAKKHSDGPSASDGGTLGWFNLEPRPELGQLQRKAIEGKAAGEITDLIELPDGFRIFRVDDRRERTEKPLTAELRRKITMRIIQERIQPAIDEYVKKLRQDAYIEIVEGCESGGETPASDEKKASDGDQGEPPGE